MTVSWMISGLVDAVAWAEGTRAGLREGGATQHRQARMRSCTTGKVQGVIHESMSTDNNSDLSLLTALLSRSPLQFTREPTTPPCCGAPVA